MKNAKFVIMLQVCFLIGIFVFSASAVYQSEQITPNAITNLAVRQPGYEPAMPEHDVYQARLSSMDSIARAAQVLKEGGIPEGAKTLDIPGVNNPVYLVSFIDEADKAQFLVVMSRGDESDAMSGIISKNEPLSNQLGIFVGLPSTESIEQLVQAAKTSSSGNAVTKEKILELILQWRSPKLAVRNKALKELKAIEPEAIKMLDKMVLKGTESFMNVDAMKSAIRYAIESGAQIEPKDANSILDRALLDKLIDKLIADADINISPAGTVKAQLLVAQSGLADAQQAAVKAFLAGKDQIDVFKSQIGSIQYKLKSLGNDLKLAKRQQERARQDLQRLDEYVVKDSWDKDKGAATDNLTRENAKVDRIEELMAENESKIEALISDIAGIQNAQAAAKASSAGIDQIDVFKSRIDSIQYKLKSLGNDLKLAKSQEKMARQELQRLDGYVVKDSWNKDKDTAANKLTLKNAEVDKIEELMAENESKIKTLISYIAGIQNAQAAAKASSGGYNKDILDAMTYLSGFTDAFTSTSRIPELNADMLSKQLETYKDTIDKLETIKSQSPEAVIAVAEQANQVQASFDTMTAVQNIAAEDAALEDVTGTILVNDNDIPDNQKILLTMLDKASPYLEALETKLGCKVRLQSQYNPKSDGAANIIAISSMPVDGITRRIDIKSVTQDGYLPLEQVIVLAKGLLTYSQDTKPALDGIIAQIYRFITKAPLSPKLLEAFLKNSIFILDLPIPIAIDEAYYEQLHRQALAALIAA